MSSGEWLSSPRTPGVVSLRLAKYVENSQMDTRISWPQGKVGSYSALKNTLVRKHCEFWPYPTPYMVSHPFPLKRQKKLANKLAESGIPPSHGLGKEFPECLRIVLAEDMGAPPALPAAPCPWIRQATQSITWPGGRRSAKYGLRFGVIYNPPKCQVGPGKPGLHARGFYENPPEPPRPRCSREEPRARFPGKPLRTAPPHTNSCQTRLSIKDRAWISDASVVFSCRGLIGLDNASFLEIDRWDETKRRCGRKL